MGRRKVELTSEFPYHVCARSNNKDWFLIPLDEVFDIYTLVLQKTLFQYKIRLHAFVLMINHFHMLVRTPEANLSEAMRYFMTESSRAIARRSHRINRIYGSRYHWTLIFQSDHYAHAYRYVYRNPVKAGVVTSVENYPWSTISKKPNLMHRLITPPSSEFLEYIPVDTKENHSWLNEPDSDHFALMMQKAMAKHHFAFGQNQNTGKKSDFFDKLHPKNTPGTI